MAACQVKELTPTCPLLQGTRATTYWVVHDGRSRWLEKSDLSRTAGHASAETIVEHQSTTNAVTYPEEEEVDDVLCGPNPPLCDGCEIDVVLNEHWDLKFRSQGS
jgi:hypothetical protein